MKVTLLNHTPEPEKLVAAAARLCYSHADDVDTLLHGLTSEKVEAFLRKLGEMPNHGTPWEHPSFTFAIEGVSRSLSHQLVRHRIASYDQQSQRYTDSSEFDYVVPPSIQKHDIHSVRYKAIMADINNLYKRLVELGVPKEDARYLMPNACCTRLICTMNLRSLSHFFSLRLCNRAQWEIREMARQMYKLCYEVSPLLFEHMGAACDQLGYCPEGSMSCGKAPTLEELLKVHKEHKLLGNITYFH